VTGLAEPSDNAFEEAIARLEARVPSRMGPELSRITALSELLGDPQTSYPSIHITGTNGKTSVARMVTALLGALGIQAGTYTSPHLQDIRERIRVAGRPISAEDFAAVHTAVERLADLVDAERDADDHVTYFEMLTAMAYWWFADHPVELGVFEVGMGGSWDATNLVRGDVAVLNTVDVDHRELGSTPAETAREKVGIIKPGSRVASATQPDDVLPLIEAAVGEKGGELLLLGRDIEIVRRTLAVGGQVVTIRTPTREHADLAIPLHGRHQADNAALALGALHALLGDLGEIDDEALREGFAAVEVPGRMEVVHRDPTVLLDGSHNPAGARRAAETVAEEFAFRDVVLVVGCLGDKDHRGLLGAFADLASHVVVTSPAGTPRATPAADLARVAEEVWAGTAVAVETADTVAEALGKATGVAGEIDGVFVTGSLYTVGEARSVYLPYA
jgi:dihydrofolate synthase / folylpolyglutamate synthase